MLIGMSVEQVAVGRRRPTAEVVGVPRRWRRRGTSGPAVGVGVLASTGRHASRSRGAGLRLPRGAVAVGGGLQRAAALVGRVARGTLGIATAVPAHQRSTTVTVDTAAAMRPESPSCSINHTAIKQTVSTFGTALTTQKWHQDDS